MPNHSEILDAADLHYAKAKLFTGSPTEITPDFAGQILMDGLGRMFVAASKNIGDLVQVAGNADGNPPNSQVRFFTGDLSQVSVDFAGQIWFAEDTKIQYIADSTLSLWPLGGVDINKPEPVYVKESSNDYFFLSEGKTFDTFFISRQGELVRLEGSNGPGEYLFGRVNPRVFVGEYPVADGDIISNTQPGNGDEPEQQLIIGDMLYDSTKSLFVVIYKDGNYRWSKVI
jgi:hypothetical protein